MTADLARLAQPLIDRPPAPPPDLDRLHRRTRELRRRRRTLRGVSLVAALAVGAIGVDRLVPDPPALQVASGDHAGAPVPRLAPVGLETAVASGTLADGVRWEMVAYEVVAADDRSERRFCTELRSDVDGPQSCFPVVDNPSSSIRWSFTERHHGALFLVVASDPGVVATLDGVPLEPGPAQDGLPVRLAATILPVGETAWLSDSMSRGGTSVNLDSESLFGMEAAGARRPYSSPAIPGIFFERLTSDDPAGDGWIGWLDEKGGVIGYLNPSDFHELQPPPDPEGGLRQEEKPDPVYDAEGWRIAWMIDGCIYRSDPSTECNSPTPTTIPMEPPS